MNVDAANSVLRLAWNLLLIGLVIAISIKLSFLFLRSLHPRIRYALCGVAFFIAIVLPVVATFFWFAPATSEKNILPGPMRIPAPVPIQDPAWPALVPDRISSRVPAALWILGALLLLMREWMSHRSLRISQRKWQPASPELRANLRWPDHIPLYTSTDDGPCTVGLFRPRVVLPDSLLNSMLMIRIQQIAQHELDHARWLDPLASCALRVGRAILWPSAPLWLLDEMAGNEREASADRAAVRNIGIETEDAALDYAESLVAVARTLELTKDGAEHAMVSLHRGRSLEERVRRLFHINDSPNRAQLASGVMFLIIGFGSTPILPVAMQPHEQAFVVRQQIVNVQKTRLQHKTTEKVVKPGHPFTTPDDSKQWKYLGDGRWLDPMGNRKPPDVMAPWKDLGNGRWLDGKGHEFSQSQLPSWVYLGEGIWYTPHLRDWMKTLQYEKTKIDLLQE